MIERPGRSSETDGRHFPRFPASFHRGEAAAVLFPNSAAIVLTLRGSVRILESEFDSGWIIFLPYIPNVRCALAPGSQAIQILVPKVEPEAIGLLFAAVRPLREESFGGIPRKIAEELEKSDEVADLAVEGLILELMARAYRIVTEVPAEVPAWLRAACTMIEERYSYPLSLADIAHAVGVSRVRLAEAFRRYFQSTVGTEIRRRRVEEVAARLVQTDEPVAEIAYAAGFYDQSHLNRIFKRYTGKSPAEFRSAHRKG